MKILFMRQYCINWHFNTSITLNYQFLFVTRAWRMTNKANRVSTRKDLSIVDHHRYIEVYGLDGKCIRFVFDYLVSMEYGEIGSLALVSFRSYLNMIVPNKFYVQCDKQMFIDWTIWVISRQEVGNFRDLNLNNHK